MTLLSIEYAVQKGVITSSEQVMVGGPIGSEGPTIFIEYSF